MTAAPLVYNASYSNSPILAYLDAQHRPAMLMSFFYLWGSGGFRKRPVEQSWMVWQKKTCYRHWILDSGAYSAWSMGAKLDLDDYIAVAKDVWQADPTLHELFGLDVFNSWRQGKANLEKMWRAGLPAIPVYHVGDPVDLLIGYAQDYPKIAIGGMAHLRGSTKLQFVEQCFQRVWPCAIHGLALSRTDLCMAAPWHCMTDEHEILTRTGWKHRLDIVRGEEILAFDDGKLRWEPTLDLYDYEVTDAPIHVFDNRSFSARVTANHRWRVWNTLRLRWEWTTTDRLHPSDRIPKTGQYQGAEAEYEDWFIELLAWFWTEGHVRPTGRVRISQSESANKDKVDRIRRSLQTSGDQFIEWTSRRDRPDRRARESVEVTFECSRVLSERMTAIFPDKAISVEFITRLSRRQLELFVQTSVDGDGNRTKRVKRLGFCLLQKGGRNVEEFRIACLLAGYATSKFQTKDGNATGTQTVVPHIVPKDAGYTRERMRHNVQPHTGNLWCVRVSSGAFLTRCRDAIYVTGNSVDASSAEKGPRNFGMWRAYAGKAMSGAAYVSARAYYDIRPEVAWYLALENKMRWKWSKEMAEIAPRLAAANWRGYGTDDPTTREGAADKPEQGIQP